MTALQIIFGIAAYIGALWVLLAVMRLDKTPQESDDKRARDIIDASRPAPLETERRHVRAGSAWGKEVAK